MKNRAFPQANNMSVIIEVLSFLMKNSGATDEEVAKHIRYNSRQGAYYTSTCYYFDLIDENNRPTKLTETLFKDNVLQPNCLFAHMIQDPIFGNIFAHYIFRTKKDIKKYTEEVIKGYFRYSDTVVTRRASTVLTMIKSMQEYILSKEDFLEILD